MSKLIVPPIKIQGIKTKLVPFIKSLIPPQDDNLWIEPFMGSGVVGFNVAPRRAIFADINPHIINFYNRIKSKDITSSTVRQFLSKEGKILAEKDIEHYYFVRERFNKYHDPLDFLFLNRSCFNGMIRFNKKLSFNVPYGHKPNRFSKAYITKITNQVANIERLILNNDWYFICQSFEETVAMADTKSFIYCDPPYIGRNVDYYDSWNEQEETALCNSLLDSKVYFILSTWDHNQYRKNNYIESTWSFCKKFTKEHFYHLGAKEQNRHSMTEALLLNYDVQARNCVTELSKEQMQLF